MRIAAIFLFCMVTAAMPAWGAGKEKPDESPEAKAKPEPATLADGQMRYTPPEGWEQVEAKDESGKPIADAKKMTATWFATDHDGLLAIQMLPTNGATDDAAGRAILRQLRDNHKKAGQEIVLAPRMEPDDRFELRIHERYKDKEGKVVDELHLYRKVGPRAAMLTIQSLSTEAEQVKRIHQIGEDMLLSAEWAKKKPLPRKTK